MSKFLVCPSPPFKYARVAFRRTVSGLNLVLGKIGQNLKTSLFGVGFRALILSPARMFGLVILVVCIFLMDYGSLWIVFTLHDLGYWLGTLPGLGQTLLSTFLFAMALTSYYKAVTTPPGRPPLRYIPEGFTEEQLEEAKDLSTSKAKTKTRGTDANVPHYCSRCERFKPPRTHHCSECDTCVLRMDHHCPWVNNCVGNNNHKLFVVFLFWASSGIFYTLFCFSIKVLLMFIEIYKGDPVTMTPLQGAVITINMVILGPMVLGISSLCCWQQGLALQNTTTIEHHIKRYAYYDAKKEGKAYEWPFDLGPPRNIISFFGTKRHLWLCPVVPDNLPDGIHFPTNTPTPHVDHLEDEESQYYPENEVEIIDI